MSWLGAAYYLELLIFAIATAGSLVELAGHIWESQRVADYGHVVAVFTWFAFLVAIALDLVVWLALYPLQS